MHYPYTLSLHPIPLGIEIQARIDELNKEMDESCCNFFGKRKEGKVAGLEELLKLGKQANMTVANAIHHVENDKRFKDHLRAGIFSNRTGDLLDWLLDPASIQLHL